MMKPTAWLGLAAVTGLVGCGSVPGGGQSRDSASWKTKGFAITLHVGPSSFEQSRSFSYYEIIPEDARFQRKLVIASAQSVGGFQSVTNGDPKNYTRIVPDARQMAVLIQEEVPNDCGPCTNYIWVRMNESGIYEHSYLTLPSGGLGISGGVDSEFPQVTTLDEGRLTYRYSDGKSVTVSAATLPSKDEPTPPG